MSALTIMRKVLDKLADKGMKGAKHVPDHEATLMHRVIENFVKGEKDIPVADLKRFTQILRTAADGSKDILGIQGELLETATRQGLFKNARQVSDFKKALAHAETIPDVVPTPDPHLERMGNRTQKTKDTGLGNVIKGYADKGEHSLAEFVRQNENQIQQLQDLGKNKTLQGFIEDRATNNLQHGFRELYNDFRNAFESDHPNAKPGADENAFYDMLGKREFRAGSTNRQSIERIVKSGDAPAPVEVPAATRQVDAAPKPEQPAKTSKVDETPSNPDKPPHIDAAQADLAMRNDLKRIGKDLERLRIKGKLSAIDSEKAEKLLDQLRDKVSITDAYKRAEKSDEGKRLSPIGVLKALQNGEPVSEDSLKKLDKYFTKNHMTQPASNAVWGTTRTILNIISGPVRAPFHGLNVFGDAHLPFSPRLGTVSALALAIGYGGIEIDYAAHPTLGMSAANILPPTILMEPFDQMGQGKDYKDLPFQADWAVLAANWSPEFKEKLQNAAAAYTKAGENLEELQKNPEFKDVTTFQITAGNHLLGLKGGNPEAEGDVAQKIADATLKKKAETEAISAVSSPYAPFLAGREFVTPQTAPTTQTAEPSTSAPQTSENGVNGAQFKHSLDLRCEEGSLNQDVADKLVTVWKQSTTMKVGEEDELSAKNVLRSSEVSTFSRNAEDVLVKSGKVPEVAKIMVEDLIRPGP